MDQHWPVARTGPLATADLGSVTCDITPLGGGCH